MNQMELSFSAKIENESFARTSAVSYTHLIQYLKNYQQLIITANRMLKLCLLLVKVVVTD